MRTARCLPLIALACLPAALVALPQSSAPGGAVSSSGGAASSPAPPQLQSSDSGYVLKVKTRLVTIDVVATDNRGNVVRDLKPEELQILGAHNDSQKIAHFAFVNGTPNASPSSAAPATAAGAPAPAILSNQVAFEHLRIPPTVLLLDALNTSDSVNQLQARKHMIRLLATLPPDTPVAVFLLSNRLRLVQSFTSNTALLRDAVNKVLQAEPSDQDPRDDSDSVLNALEQGYADSEMTDDETFAMALFEDFEKEAVANAMDIRVKTTVDALTAIARSVDGIPGRKNLIWISESFPMSIDPDTDSGYDTFAGTRAYADQVEAASNALTDAQVAVYPVDVRGVQTTQAFAATQGPVVSRKAPQVALNNQITREDNARVQSLATMTSLAENTGGRACQNNNDLSGCLAAALNDDSSYYELAFYPQDIAWDGHFHKIAVKTTRRGIKLNYRHGYFALDGEQLAKQEKPGDRLREACSDFLPATAIHLQAQPAPPRSPALPRALNYSVRIEPSALTVLQNGATRAINVQAAVCQFAAKDNSFRFSTQDLAGNVSDDVLQQWQARGFTDALNIAPEPATRRIRFVVLDVPTGLTGALDIPVAPANLAKPAAASLAPAALSPVLEIPAGPGQTQKKSMSVMNFNGPSGQSAALDWNSDTLLYRGDLLVEQSAPAFFSFAFGPSFHCLAATPAPADTSPAASPVGPAAPLPASANLRITMRNYDGRFVTVDLAGDGPQYSGTMAVDSTAKIFFAQVWKLTRCSQ